MCNEPLIEAIWELRLKSPIESVAEILPGIIYSALNRKYQFKIEKLPISAMPVSLLADDNLKFVPVVRLAGLGAHIQVAHQAVSLNVVRPYPGWTEFGKRIRELVEVLRASGLAEAPERFSLKYLDIISGKSVSKPIRLEAKLGDRNISDKFLFRTENTSGEFTQIVQIVSEATGKWDDNEVTGLLLDTDVVCSPAVKEDFWDKFDLRLDAAHVLSRDLFFSLLTDEMIGALEPEY